MHKFGERWNYSECWQWIIDMNLNKFNATHPNRKTVCHIPSRTLALIRQAAGRDGMSAGCREWDRKSASNRLNVGRRVYICGKLCDAKFLASEIDCLHYFAFIYILLVVFGWIRTAHNINQYQQIICRRMSYSRVKPRHSPSYVISKTNKCIKMRLSLMIYIGSCGTSARTVTHTPAALDYSSIINIELRSRHLSAYPTTQHHFIYLSLYCAPSTRCRCSIAAYPTRKKSNVQTMPNIRNNNVKYTKQLACGIAVVSETKR